MSDEERDDKLAAMRQHKTRAIRYLQQADKEIEQMTELATDTLWSAQEHGYCLDAEHAVVGIVKSLQNIPDRLVAKDEEDD